MSALPDLRAKSRLSAVGPFTDLDMVRSQFHHRRRLCDRKSLARSYRSARHPRHGLHCNQNMCTRRQCLKDGLTLLRVIPGIRAECDAEA